MRALLAIVGVGMIYGGGVLVGISVEAESGLWPHWGVGFILVVSGGLLLLGHDS